MADIPNAALSVEIIDEASGTYIVPNADHSLPVGVLNSSSVRIDPATDRTTAAAPFAFRLSDGAAFYNALTDTQLRASAVPISGTVTANQGTPIAIASAWPTKITDGTNTALVSSAGGLIVAGLTAVGATPANNPISVSGVDGGGLKRHLLTDAGGRLLVLNSDGTNTAAVKAASTAPVATDTALVVTISPNSPDPDSGSTGSAVPAKAAYVAGKDASGNLQPLLIDSSGNLKVVPNTSATTSPQTTGSGESFAKRAYQTTIEVTLGTINAEQNILLFRNPNASGKTVYIKNITFTSLTSGKSCILRVYSNPTATANGTTITPQSMYIGGGAAAAASFTTSAPTTSAVGTKITVAGDTNEQAIIDYDWGLIVSANNSLLITGTPSANNTSFVANIIWSEV